MLTKKYTISLLDSKWQVIKRNMKMNVVPRKDEFIWYLEKYYLILNIIYTLNPNDEIILVVEEQAIKNSEIIL
jgi:hypothetical protein